MPELRREPSSCPPAPCASPPFSPAPGGTASSTPPALAQPVTSGTTGGITSCRPWCRFVENACSKGKKSRKLSPPALCQLKILPAELLRLDHPVLEQLLVAQPQVRYVRRPEPQDILERPAHLAQPEVHADLLEQIDQRLRSFGQHRLGARPGLVEAVIVDDVEGVRPRSVPHDVQKPSCFRLLRPELCGQCGTTGERAHGVSSFAVSRISCTRSCFRNSRTCSRPRSAPSACRIPSMSARPRARRVENCSPARWRAARPRSARARSRARFRQRSFPRPARPRRASGNPPK